jgi:hypothetical protein
MALCAIAVSGSGFGQNAHAGTKVAADADPVIRELAKLVGGKWIAKLGLNKDFIAEGTAELTANGRAVKWTGVIGKGRPDAIYTTSMFGWDPLKKTAYYIDFHGHDTVYNGTVKKEGDKLVLEFETLVGPASRWKSEQSMPDKNTLRSMMWSWKDGAWVKGGHEGITFRREPAEETK